MREKDFLKIKKDTEMYLDNEKVLLHRYGTKVYILSNIAKLSGSTCYDFSVYRDRYKYSYYIYNHETFDWDEFFRRECLSKLQYDKEILGCL